MSRVSWHACLVKLSLLTGACTKPFHKVPFCQFAGGEAKHGIHCVGRLRLLQLISISLEEFDNRQPPRALVPFGQRMVLCKASRQQSSLLSRLRIGLLTLPTRRRHRES